VILMPNGLAGMLGTLWRKLKGDKHART